jgi:rubredoxin
VMLDNAEPPGKHGSSPGTFWAFWPKNSFN